MEKYLVKTVNNIEADSTGNVDATEFVINSTSATDDSTVNWWIAP